MASRRTVIWWGLLWGVAVCGSGIAPLPQGRAIQAATYADGGHPDQAALYALLADVSEWEPGDETGAAVVDWDAVLADPAAWRGRAVLVEGADAGGRKRIELVRPEKLWGDAVTQRGIVVRGDTQTGEDVLPVVVWFVDPDDQIAPAVHGQPVRVAGRFLGLWIDRDAHGTPRSYPVVVAKSVRVVDRAAGGPGTTGVGWPAGMAALGVAALLFVLWGVSRWFVRVDVVQRRRAERARRHEASAGSEADDEPGELPEEEAAALEVLASRHGGSEHD